MTANSVVLFNNGGQGWNIIQRKPYTGHELNIKEILVITPAERSRSLTHGEPPCSIDGPVSLVKFITWDGYTWETKYQSRPSNIQLTYAIRSALSASTTREEYPLEDAIVAALTALNH